MTALAETVWVELCPLESIAREQGVAALLPDGTQVAVFRTHDDAVYALGNQDPFSGAWVLSRGILGDIAGVPVVASPMHKQHFDLRTGVCVDDETVSVPTYPVRVVDATILLGQT
ncbi:nitrite reductase small subunit NirD [Actinokineospora iranica]|uniref:Nitrite reductase (NADH) small subunit n=1 Tax=Actinokineospora iranica TaxID=1271860 RepID=A0A1G6R3Z9_9PSEU|nr:nitrite reductase small subunit NirD [Actinokineospora iranica]SDC98727.1 nitrite reductase (NADH) small subunit [Actinokineospora iranica]